MHIGVMIKFEKVGPEPPMIMQNEDDAFDINNRTWTSTRNLIYVRSGPKGYSVGHWPIPEAYCPDQGNPNLPPRSALPIVRFTCANSEPAVIDNLPFDKYELDPSPLTHFILSRKQPNVAWQVYVANSQRNSDLGQPFGYLKASTNLSCVNLFVLPYNYPVLLPLLDELFKSHQGKPTREWRQNFDLYLKMMPVYYAIPLRRALQRMGANSAMVPESMDVYTTVTLNNLIKKNKNLAKMEFEKLAASVGSQRPIGIEWPRISITSSHLSSSFGRKCNLEHCSNPSLRKLFSNLQNDQQDFNGFVVRYKDKPNAASRAHSYRNPFDISRHDLIDQVHKLRRNFFQKQTSLIKFQDEDQLHSLPVSQMGNYQEYLKRLPIPLREIEALPARQHMFGNPFKLDKKNMMMIDETDIDLVSNGGGSNSGRGKRSVSDPFSVVGSKQKRKPGPLPKDYPYNRPLTPPASPMPSLPYSPSSSPSHASYTPPPPPMMPFNAHSNSSPHLNPFNNSIAFQNLSNGPFPGKPVQSNGHFAKSTKGTAAGSPLPVPGSNNTLANLQNNKSFEQGDITAISAMNSQMMSATNSLSNANKLVRASAVISTKRPLPMTNGISTANKMLKLNHQDPSEQNGFDELSGYVLNFYRRRNFSMEEYEKKLYVMKLVRRTSKGKLAFSFVYT